MEAHVMASLQAALRVLHTLLGEPVPADLVEGPPITFDNGAAMLAEHSNAILGPAPQGRQTRIMVTMPGEAADDSNLIRGLVEAGMGIMRINCAHDSPKTWERMVKLLREAERDLGKRCLVSFDLAGPKLRTGPIAPGPAVVKWRPTRNAVGQVTEPASVRLVAGGNQPGAKQPTIPVEAALLGKAKKVTPSRLQTRAIASGCFTSVKFIQASACTKPTGPPMSCPERASRCGESNRRSRRERWARCRRSNSR
jgi:pyruvate kinase